MFAKYTVLAAAALLVSTGASAQVGITADLGTTGAGFHLVVPMASQLNGRFGANAFSHDFDKSSDGIDYKVKGKLQTVDALFDWYLRPGGNFRLTGGVIYNGNKFDALAKTNTLGQLTINGHTYNPVDVGVLTGHVDYRKAAPYVGIGWGNALAQEHRWHFNTDLGAFFQGSPNVQLASVGCTTSQAVCQAVATDAAAIGQRFGNDINNFKVYPVLRASLSYRF